MTLLTSESALPLSLFPPPFSFSSLSYILINLWIRLSPLRNREVIRKKSYPPVFWGIIFKIFHQEKLSNSVQTEGVWQKINQLRRLRGRLFKWHVHWIWQPTRTRVHLYTPTVARGTPVDIAVGQLLGVNHASCLCGWVLMARALLTNWLNLSGLGEPFTHLTNNLTQIDWFSVVLFNSVSSLEACCEKLHILGPVHLQRHCNKDRMLVWATVLEMWLLSITYWGFWYLSSYLWNNYCS